MDRLTVMMLTMLPAKPRVARSTFHARGQSRPSVAASSAMERAQCQTWSDMMAYQLRCFVHDAICASIVSSDEDEIDRVRSRM
jgi:hypothetical protein